YPSTSTPPQPTTPCHRSPTSFNTMAEETQVVNDAPVESVEKKEEAAAKTEQTTETTKAEGGDDSTTAVTSDGKEQLTIFHNQDNFSVKHPLMNKWTLWFTKPPSGKVCSLNRLSLPGIPLLTCWPFL